MNLLAEGSHRWRWSSLKGGSFGGSIPPASTPHDCVWNLQVTYRHHQPPTVHPYTRLPSVHIMNPHHWSTCFLSLLLQVPWFMLPFALSDVWCGAFLKGDRSCFSSCKVYERRGLPPHWVGCVFTVHLPISLRILQKRFLPVHSPPEIWRESLFLGGAKALELLPREIWSAPSLALFRKCWKGELLRRAFICCSSFLSFFLSADASAVFNCFFSMDSFSQSFSFSLCFVVLIICAQNCLERS